MRLHSLALVWRLRRAVRQRVRKSKSLRRRARWWRRSFRLERPAIYEPLLTIVLAVVIAIHRDKGNAWLLACLTLYCTATAVLRSRQLQSLMTTSPERLLFHFYPLSDAHFFHWGLQGFLWKTVRIWLACGVVFAFVFESRNEPWFWKAAAFATLEWLVTLAVIMALAAYVYGINKWVPAGLYLATIVVFYAGSLPYIASIYPVLQFLPAGWVDFAIAAFHGWVSEWIALITLMALAACSVWMLIIRFRARIVAEGAPELLNDPEHEPKQQSMGVLDEDARLEELMDEEEEPARPQTGWQNLRRQLVGASVEKQILSRDWLASRDWSAEAWLERMTGAWLTEEEKTTAELLLGGAALHWHELWRGSVIVAGAASVLFVVGLPSTYAMGILAAGLSALVGVPVLGGSWPATSPARLSGKFSPLHGCFPLEYRIACRVMWKINLVRTAAWTPFGIVMGAFAGLSHGSGAGIAAWLVLKGVLVYAVATPLLSAGQFSKSTNDTSNLRLATLPLVGFALLIVLMLVTAGIMTMALPMALAFVSLGVTLAISVGAWWLYGRYYERGQVDLLREPK